MKCHHIQMVTTDVIKTKPSNGYNLFNEEQQALHDAYVKTGDSEFLWKLQDLVKNPSKEWAIRSAKNVIRHAGMSADDVAVEKNNNAARQKIHNDRHYKNEKELLQQGDPAAIARREINRELQRQRSQNRKRLRIEDNNAKITELFGETGHNSTKFGEGEERAKFISEVVQKIMKNHAGFAHPIGAATTKNWVNCHGDVSLEKKLRGGNVASYLGITRTSIVPSEETQCEETRKFLTETTRNPLWRIKEGEDLKRFNIPQARNVIKTYLLAECKSAYDITSLEGMCQLYLEDEIEMPHGMCLHREAGAGSRQLGILTPSEIEVLRDGGELKYSLFISMIEVEDCVFAEIDPVDELRSPPLVSASVPTQDGTDEVYRIQVRGHKESFKDTDSVSKDKKSIVAKYATHKARHEKRKRDTEE
jgi:hypothetical protein